MGVIALIEKALGRIGSVLSMRRMSALGFDLVIVGIYFAIILGIGWHFSRRNASVADFALGGRSIPWWAVLASILASEISAGTFLGHLEMGSGCGTTLTRS